MDGRLLKVWRAARGGGQHWKDCILRVAGAMFSWYVLDASSGGSYFSGR